MTGTVSLLFICLYYAGGSGVSALVLSAVSCLDGSGSGCTGEQQYSHGVGISVFSTHALLWLLFNRDLFVKKSTFTYIVIW